MQATLLKRMDARIAAGGDLALNRQEFKAETIKEPSTLLDALNTLPFAALYRLVVVRELEGLLKPVSEALVDYLKAPNPTTVLVLTASKLASNTRLYKAIAASHAQAIVQTAAKKQPELLELIGKMARDQGVGIDRQAAEVLTRRLGNNTVALNNEIVKLAAMARAAQRRSIDLNSVQSHVVRSEEPKPWDLTNVVLARDLPRALQLLARMQSASPIALLFQIVVKLRDVLRVQGLRQLGLNPAVELKRPEWQLRNELIAASRYSRQELEGLLRLAPVTEKGMKSGGDASQLLQQFIVAACQGVAA